MKIISLPSEKCTHWIVPLHCNFPKCVWSVTVNATLHSGLHVFISPPQQLWHHLGLMTKCYPMSELMNMYTSPWLEKQLFSRSVANCPTLCDPMDCSMPCFRVFHHLLEFAQTHVHWVHDGIQLFHPRLSPSPPAFNLLPASGSFPVSRIFASGGQSIGASASASIFPMNIQGSFPLRLLV